MPEYRINRPTGLSLEFSGELLADVSSWKDEDQPRWHEIRIFRTDTGRYVVERVGRSVVVAEANIIDTAAAFAAADEVVAALHTSSEGRRYLTNPSSSICGLSPPSSPAGGAPLDPAGASANRREVQPPPPPWGPRSRRCDGKPGS